MDMLKNRYRCYNVNEDFIRRMIDPQLHNDKVREKKKSESRATHFFSIYVLHRNLHLIDSPSNTVRYGANAEFSFFRNLTQ